ncbi:MAG: hypothetical protein LBR26_02415 [Prevotella sp.]|nr:hypothetical protein [Prevotella sp.]
MAEYDKNGIECIDEAMPWKVSGCIALAGYGWMSMGMKKIHQLCYWRQKRGRRQKNFEKRENSESRNAKIICTFTSALPKG